MAVSHHRHRAGPLAVLATFLGVLALAGPAAAAGEVRRTFTATADAHASSRHPASTFAADRTMLVRGGEDAAVGYLRFRLGGINGRRIVSATLRLSRAAGRRPSQGQVRRGRIAWSPPPTWERQRARPGSRVGSLASARVVPGGLEVPLATAGWRDGDVTLILSTGAEVALRSGTIEAGRPARLVIRTAGGAVTPPPPPPPPSGLVPLPSPQAPPAPAPPASPPATPAPPSGAPGCGQPLTRGATTRTVMVAGVRRSFLEIVPASLAQGVAAPVILAFHGGNDTAANANAYMGLTGAEAAVYVYPQAGPFADAWAGWDVDPAGADFPFVDALLADLRGRHCVDRDRVFAVGKSNGAFFANSLLCMRPEAFRAAASVAGGGPQFNCSQPRAFLGVHGAADGPVPIATGRFSRDHWREANGATGAPTQVAPSPCVSYPGGANPVVWCEHAGGHVWPSWAGAAIRGFLLER